MFDVNKAIYACDDVICRNIESFTTEQRGLLSQNILWLSLKTWGN